jgi:hypothetical protein
VEDGETAARWDHVRRIYDPALRLSPDWRLAEARLLEALEALGARGAKIHHERVASEARAEELRSRFASDLAG